MYATLVRSAYLMDIDKIAKYVNFQACGNYFHLAVWFQEVKCEWVHLSSAFTNQLFSGVV